ncbi:MAG: efflux RND transporter periplasmic adaptor subunit [Pseudomonadota bacterium]
MDTSSFSDGHSIPEPRRMTGFRMAWFAFILVAAGAVLGGGAVWLFLHGDEGSHPRGGTAHEHEPLYQCPMHPSITADHPGDCPICGMRLVEVDQAVSAPPTAGEPTVGAPATAPTTSPPAHAVHRKIKFYRSPMDPKQTSPTPRKDEMGMDYIPVFEDEVEENEGQQIQGLATVSIDPARQQLIGLRTAPVVHGSVAGDWRTVGRVQIDPTRVRKTNVKVEGYIESLYVDFVGRPVRRGEPLFSIYSPSLLAAENEYLLALQTREALWQGRDRSGAGAGAGSGAGAGAGSGAGGDGSGDGSGGGSGGDGRGGGGGMLAASGDALVASARRKLELWDVPAKEIERLEQARQPSKSLIFVSPIAGVVTAKNVVEGTRVNLGDTPFEITDLGTVWVMADAYEVDLSRVRVGMRASLTVQAYPSQSFRGKIEFVDPFLDPQTRTAKVRMHVANPTGILKPEMFGEVVLEGTKREGLRVPADAVIRSGTKDVVFLALGNGRFAPREVRLGAKSSGGEQVEVVSGLAEGQEVVVRANFLVDSESQLRSSLAAIGGQ